MRRHFPRIDFGPKPPAPPAGSVAGLVLDAEREPIEIDGRRFFYTATAAGTVLTFRLYRDRIGGPVVEMHGSSFLSGDPAANRAHLFEMTRSKLRRLR